LQCFRNGYAVVSEEWGTIGGFMPRVTVTTTVPIAGKWVLGLMMMKMTEDEDDVADADDDADVH
jgi:hypothetical protein